MASSIGYEATILQGIYTPIQFVNTGASDMQVGTIQYVGKQLGIITGPSSSDGTTYVASNGGIGSWVTQPGLNVLYSCFTTDTPGVGALLFWDASNKRLTTNTTLGAGNPYAGIANISKAAGVATIEFNFNQPPGVTVVNT